MINTYGNCRFSSKVNRKFKRTLLSFMRKTKHIKILLIGTVTTLYLAKQQTANHRPEILKIFKDLKKGEAKAELIHILDRFARNQTNYAFHTRKLGLIENEL